MSARDLCQPPALARPSGPGHDIGELRKIIDSLSPEEQHTTLIWLSGAQPRAFEGALQHISLLRAAALRRMGLVDPLYPCVTRLDRGDGPC
jgi:hypothetical protein